MGILRYKNIIRKFTYYALLREVFRFGVSLDVTIESFFPPTRGLFGVTFSSLMSSFAFRFTSSSTTSLFLLLGFDLAGFSLTSVSSLAFFPFLKCGLFSSSSLSSSLPLILFWRLSTTALVLPPTVICLIFSPFGNTLLSFSPFFPFVLLFPHR